MVIATEFKLVLFSIAWIFISACGEDNVSVPYELIPSGVYKNCLNLSFKNASVVFINKKKITTNNIEVCENSVIEVNNGVNIPNAKRVYIFEDDVVTTNIIDNAMTLWYNSPSVIKSNNMLYVGFVTKNGDVKISQITNNALPKSTIVFSFPYGDDHSAPALAINDNGHLILTFSFHSSPLYRAISDKPLSIDNFNVGMIDSGFTSYPTLINKGDNELSLYFRKGFAGNNSKGEYHVKHSSDGGLKWTDSKAVIQFPQKYIVFSFTKKLDNKIFIVFSLLNRDTNRYEGLYLTYSEDGIDDWKNIDSTSNIISKNNAIKIIDDIENIRIHDLMMNNGNLMISYSVFEEEFLCCELPNSLYLYDVDNKKSYFVGNGLINYYSDGITFDKTYDGIGYYFSRDIFTDTSRLKVVNFQDLNNIETFSVNLQGGKNIRFIPIASERVLTGHWISVNRYNSYLDFDSSINLNYELDSND